MFKKLNLNILIALTISLVYLIVNCLYINTSHFHEDAYIMFRYVEMFTQGYGITYYPGGEPTEGATDFLWFLLLSFLNILKIDTGLASILLNTGGVFLLSLIFTIIIMEVKNRKNKLFLFPLTFIWLLFIPILAALGGFSVFLYCSIILLAFHYLYKKKNLLTIPILSIIIALFRPDGVILGSCFTLIGLYFCEIENRKAYYRNIIIAFIIGVFYFLSRYYYFKELLPLPLYVKQTKDSLETIYGNLSILLSYSTILGVVLFSFLFFQQEKKEKKQIIILLIPILVFFSILSTAHQSQNIGYRFQGPIIYMLYYLIIIMIIKTSIYNLKKAFFCLTVFYILILDASIFTIRNLVGSHYYYNDNAYINIFPNKIKKHILADNDAFAITEAGRLVYWLDTKPVKIIDLVGLNTKYTAKNKLTKNYLENLNPDIIMAYIGNSFPKNSKDKVYWIKDKLQAENYLMKKGQFNNINHLNNEFLAMVVTTDYLTSNWEKYDVFFVYYGGWYPHVYAIKKDRNQSDLFFKLLQDSFIEKKSYFDLKLEAEK